MTFILTRHPLGIRSSMTVMASVNAFDIAPVSRVRECSHARACWSSSAKELFGFNWQGCGFSAAHESPHSWISPSSERASDKTD